MAEARFNLTVKRGVEHSPMEDLSQHELASRIDTLREWFNLDGDDFEVTVAPTPAETLAVGHQFDSGSLSPAPTIRHASDTPKPAGRH